ncbi:hypothetical protein RB196_19075 [Streptomyces sp. PmtA]|uniref:hypothetical protein n=1 Tax=Streptomyces sp. PmtA TaxID=3074275 RepID=UPI0030147DDD
MPSACETDGDPSDCDDGSGGLGFFDVSGMIVNAITSFLGTLVEQIMKPVREFLAATLLATPDVTRHADIKTLWKALLGITAGIYVLFVTAGGITVMGYETVQTRYTVKEIAPRLLLGFAAAASSLTVMGKAIGLSNALAHAVMATDMAGAGQGMVERVLPFAVFGAPGVQLYLLLLALVMIALVLAVLIGFLVRVAVMALLAVCAPLMLACHAHPLTDPIARLWWRALGGCLVIQVAQSVTFVLALKLFFAPGATTLGIPRSDQLGTMLAGVSLFWVLFKIPGWTLQVVLRGSPIQQPGGGLRVLKHLAMYRLVRPLLPRTCPAASRWPGRGTARRGRPGSGAARAGWLGSGSGVARRWLAAARGPGSGPDGVRPVAGGWADGGSSCPSTGRRPPGPGPARSPPSLPRAIDNGRSCQAGATGRFAAGSPGGCCRPRRSGAATGPTLYGAARSSIAGNVDAAVAFCAGAAPGPIRGRAFPCPVFGRRRSARPAGRVASASR